MRVHVGCGLNGVKMEFDFRFTEGREEYEFPPGIVELASAQVTADLIAHKPDIDKWLSLVLLLDECLQPRQTGMGSLSSFMCFLIEGAFHKVEWQGNGTSLRQLLKAEDGGFQSSFPAIDLAFTSITEQSSAWVDFLDAIAFTSLKMREVAEPRLREILRLPPVA